MKEEGGLARDQSTYVFLTPTIVDKKTAADLSHHIALPTFGLGVWKNEHIPSQSGCGYQFLHFLSQQGSLLSTQLFLEVDMSNV